MVRRGRPSIHLQLPADDRHELERRVRAATTPQRDVLRARIILACAEGGTAIQIAHRLGGETRRFVFHYTPKHASWVNQVELFFSILQRQCLNDGSFRSKDELREAATAFIDGWNQRAQPFQWTFKGYPLRIGPLAEAA